MNFWLTISILWRPALEILILAALIYFAFVLVRGTRGFAVVTGFLGLLISLTLITKLLQLPVLSVLLNQLFPFLAVAIVILFQPELRRILGELGNLRTPNAIREQTENIEVIIQTVDRLAPGSQKWESFPCAASAGTRTSSSCQKMPDVSKSQAAPPAVGCL